VKFFAELETSADHQERAYYGCARSALLLAQGRPSEALHFAEAALQEREAMGITHHAVKESFVTAVQAALEEDNVPKVEELLASVERLPHGQTSQFFQAHELRFRARLAARGGDSVDAQRHFKGAAGLFREMAMPFYLAVAELEQAEWLVTEGRIDEAEAVLVEAREIFERLEATPWLERVAQLGPARKPEAAIS
jgi:hypothetical protein